jgi:hypothetical protein
MMFNATFNNISAISWRSVLLVGETGIPGETTDLPQLNVQCDPICTTSSSLCRRGCTSPRISIPHLYARGKSRVIFENGIA